MIDNGFHIWKSRETEGAKKRLGKKGNPFPIWTYPRIDWLSSFRQFESY